MYKELIAKLKQKGLTAAAAESCTGGLIADAFVSEPGASEVFAASLVTYNDSQKQSLLNVKKATLDKYTAVSSRTAAEMCENAARLCGTDIGISSTGYAGPDGGTQADPVGTVYIGVYIYGKVHVKRLSLSGGRNNIRQNAVSEAIALLEQLL